MKYQQFNSPFLTVLPQALKNKVVGVVSEKNTSPFVKACIGITVNNIMAYNTNTQVIIYDHLQGCDMDLLVRHFKSCHTLISFTPSAYQNVTTLMTDASLHKHMSLQLSYKMHPLDAETLDKLISVFAPHSKRLIIPFNRAQHTTTIPYASWLTTFAKLRKCGYRIQHDGFEPNSEASALVHRARPGSIMLLGPENEIPNLKSFISACTAKGIYTLGLTREDVQAGAAFGCGQETAALLAPFIAQLSEHLHLRKEEAGTQETVWFNRKTLKALKASPHLKKIMLPHVGL